MNHIRQCAVCGNTKFNDFIVCKDYTVSKEEFQIVECQQCNFRFTNPIPQLSDIGKYYESEDYISHSNTSKDLISKIYQIARKSSLRKKYRIVSERVEGNRLLDIGSGTGEFLKECSHNGLTVNGVEPSEQARNFSKKEYSLEVYEEDQLRKWPEKSFDIISMWHVLEHVYELNERLNEIKRLLSDHGRVFVAVPNCASKDAQKYKAHWAAYDVPRHLYHFRKEQMQELWEKHGFVIEEILPMKLDAYYVSLLSEKYKGSGILSYVNGFFSGLASNLAANRTGEWSSLIYVIAKK